MPDQNFANALANVYTKCGFAYTAPIADTESTEYQACTYKVNNLRIIARTAKITPKKVGQFVAIWQRDENGITQPQHIDDNFDLLIINCQDGKNHGQFVFPKPALAKNNIISTPTKRGKNGIRVYPPWAKPTNNQAVKTQAWQLQYFLNLTKAPNPELAKTLYTSA